MYSPPKPTRIPSSTLQREIGTILKRVSVNGEHLTITNQGFPIAVIMPVSDYQALIEILEHQTNT